MASPAATFEFPVAARPFGRPIDTIGHLWRSLRGGHGAWGLKAVGFLETLAWFAVADFQGQLLKFSNLGGDAERRIKRGVPWLSPLIFG